MQIVLSDAVVAALAGGFVGGLIGSLSGLISSYYLQNRSWRHSRNEFAKERAYSPLFNEFEAIIESVEGGASLFPRVWNEIKNYRYSIKDDDFRQRIRNFYVQTVPAFNEAMMSCAHYFPSIVDKDLRTKLPSTVAIESLITNVSNHVGWNLHRDDMRDSEFLHVNRDFEQLKTLTDSKLTGNLEDYFLNWKREVSNDTHIIEYNRVFVITQKEAKDVKHDLEMKLNT